MTEQYSETQSLERNCTNFAFTSTPIKLHSAQGKSKPSPIIKQLATCHKLSSVKQLAEMVFNWDSENAQMTKKSYRSVV